MDIEIKKLEDESFEITQRVAVGRFKLEDIQRKKERLESELADTNEVIEKINVLIATPQ